MITVEGKIRDGSAYKALAACGSLSSKISHQLYVDRHIKKKPLNELKNSYLKKHGISSRHFNSIRYAVDSKAEACAEKEKELIQNKERQIKETEKKIVSITKDIKDLRSTKKSLLTHLDKVKAWRIQQKLGKKPKLAKKLQGEKLEKLEASIKKSLFVLHQKKRRLAILSMKLQDLQDQGVGLCFGSRQLFHKQYNLKENEYESHAEWLADWRFARSSQSFWLGSHDESYRNLNCQYDPAKNSLSLRMPYCLEETYGSRVVIENVTFRYGQEQLEDAILNPIEIWNEKTQSFQSIFRPVSYRILARKKKKADKEVIEYFCQAMFEERPVQVDSDKRLGAIGIDLNADHIAVCETDRFGNPVGGTSYAFTMPTRSSNQISAVFGDHIAMIVQRAKVTGKIIVCEQLDFTKKKQALRETTNKKQRAMLSSFAYKKFFTLLAGRAKKEGVRVKDINPAYTSVIGFYKFQGYKIYTTHELAALAIARRGLGFSERTKIKNAPDGTVSNHGIDEALLFFQEKQVGHVWSYYSRNAKRIRTLIRSQSNPSREEVAYNPFHPSGYCEVSLRIKCEKSPRPSLPP